MAHCANDAVVIAVVNTIRSMIFFIITNNLVGIVWAYHQVYNHSGYSNIEPNRKGVFS